MLLDVVDKIMNPGEKLAAMVSFGVIVFVIAVFLAVILTRGDSD
jgi:hypothetical protein